jgi:Cu/Ag efflux protein CusF
MKTTRTKTWMAVYASVLATTAAFRASADQPVLTAQPEKTYTGTVVSVDPSEHVLSVQGWMMFHKAFNLGDNCACHQLDKQAAAVNDLRPGEKVKVRYQDVHGVRIADLIEQEPMRIEGMVTAIDAEQHTLTLHRAGLDKALQLADDCKVVLRDGKAGTLAYIQVGNHVTVTYETPGSPPTARQIAQTSIEFTGTLTAIDLEAKTVKAKATFGAKKFNLADNCAIVINGKPDGRLADLKPNDKLTFSYDEINGVNVVNRIAPAAATPNSVAGNLPMSPMTGY